MKHSNIATKLPFMKIYIFDDIHLRTWEDSHLLDTYESIRIWRLIVSVFLSLIKGPDQVSSLPSASTHGAHGARTIFDYGGVLGQADAVLGNE